MVARANIMSNSTRGGLQTKYEGRLDPGLYLKGIQSIGLKS